MIIAWVTVRCRAGGKKPAIAATTSRISASSSAVRRGLWATGVACSAMALHPLACPPHQQALGPPQQEGDEKKEDERVAIGPQFLRQIGLERDRDDADQETPERGAGQRAHATDHRSD